MKKLLAILLLVTLLSCEDAGVKNPGGDQDFIIIVDGVRYKVKDVRFGGGNGIYIMVPESSKVELPKSINFQSGDDRKTVIKVK